MAAAKLYPVSVTLSEAEMVEAVRLLMHKRGLVTTDQILSLTVHQVPPDRPFDSTYTTFSVSGVFVEGPSP